MYKKLKSLLGNLEIPDNSEYGHYSSNILKRKMADISIIDKIKEFEYVEDVIIINDFINIKIKKEYLKVLPIQPLVAEEEKCSFLFEAFSPNPTGKVHVGHARNIYTAKLLNFLRFIGHEVLFELYINDVGNQIKEFIKSIHYKICEIKGLSTEGLTLYYKNDEILKIAENFQDQEINKKNIIKYVVDNIKKDGAKLGVIHDNVVYESDLMPFFQTVREKLKDYLEIGRIKNVYEEYETNKDHLLLKIPNGEKFVMIKENKFEDWEEYSYVARDLAYFIFKTLRLKDKKNPCLVYVLGEDHNLHIKKLQQSFKLLDPSIPVTFIQYAFVHLKDGKLSKRSGNCLSFDEILSKMSKNALGFAMLSSSFNTKIKLDLENLDDFINWDLKLKLIKENLQAILDLNKDVFDVKLNNMWLKTTDLPIKPIKNKIFNLLLSWEMLFDNIKDTHIACIHLKELLNISESVINESIEHDYFLLSQLYNRIVILENLLFN